MHCTHFYKFLRDLPLFRELKYGSLKVTNIAFMYVLSVQDQCHNYLFFLENCLGTGMFFT